MYPRQAVLADSLASALLQLNAELQKIQLAIAQTVTRYGGLFTKTTTLTPSAVDTEYLLTFDEEAENVKVGLGTPTSRVYVHRDGHYQFTALLQLSSTTASAKTVRCWFKLNGVVTGSSRLVTVKDNGAFTILVQECLFRLVAGDYLELAVAVDALNVSVAAVAATAYAPEAPAVTLTVTQVQLNAPA